VQSRERKRERERERERECQVGKMLNKLAPFLLETWLIPAYETALCPKTNSPLCLNGSRGLLKAQLRG
jgi:hypothetical protein